LCKLHARHQRVVVQSLVTASTALSANLRQLESQLYEQVNALSHSVRYVTLRYVLRVCTDRDMIT